MQGEAKNIQSLLFCLFNGKNLSIFVLFISIGVEEESSNTEKVKEALKDAKDKLKDGGKAVKEELDGGKFTSASGDTEV